MSDQRLARPLYEALPWIYLLCGLAALTASYLTKEWNDECGNGPAGAGGDDRWDRACCYGVADFRKMRADYLEGDASEALSAAGY